MYNVQVLHTSSLCEFAVCQNWQSVKVRQLVNFDRTPFRIEWTVKCHYFFFFVSFQIIGYYHLCNYLHLQILHLNKIPLLGKKTKICKSSKHILPGYFLNFYLKTRVWHVWGLEIPPPLLTRIYPHHMK